MTALIRIRAGIFYALAEAMDEGHCDLPFEKLIPLAEKCSKCQPNSSKPR
jgi:exodeoxyribonuclease V alpha subunit